MNDGGDTQRSIVDATFAELAFLLVFALFVGFAVSSDREHVDGAARAEVGGLVRRIEALGLCACRIDDAAIEPADAAPNVIRIRIACDDGGRLFESGAWALTDVGAACFDAICPLLYDVLRSPQSRVERVAIEGHASPEFRDFARMDLLPESAGESPDLDCRSPAHCNQILSSLRSLRAYDYCGEAYATAGGGRSEIDIAERRGFFDDITDSAGFGARRPLPVEAREPGREAEVDDDASRRVEFRLLGRL